MIKKHLITCSALLGILLLAKAFIYSKPAEPKQNPVVIAALDNTEAESTEEYFNTLNFAEEFLPLGDEKVKWKMNQALKSNHFDKLRTNKIHASAKKWFPVIIPVLKKYGIPEDFKYMPLVESGLQWGTSPKGASGYWQFMPGTARLYGLKVGNGIDERQNIYKSTVAACKYLNALYKEFGSWTLAAAAYNVGENTIHKQIRVQRHDNYYRLRLNKETASYVYKLISMKEIIENPQLYGYKSKRKHTDPPVLAANVNAPVRMKGINRVDDFEILKGLSFLHN